MGYSAFIKYSGVSALLAVVSVTAVFAEDMNKDEHSQNNKVAAATIDDFDELPAGYHRMPDGTVMANSPTSAVAPPGYHLMPDGTLMANGSDMDSVSHQKHGGMWMTDYKSTQMYMGGLLDTTDKISGEDVVAVGSIYADNRGYSMAPKDMSMDMHMFMFMYHDARFMAMLMLHYMKNEMTMITSTGEQGNMSTSGLGDTVATIEFPFKPLHAKYSVGISVPTGSITESGPMVGMVGDIRYPYAMQLGSGTYDVLLGAGIEQRKSKITYAANYQYVLRTGENSEGYTLGNKYTLDGLIRFHFSSAINGDLSLSFLEFDSISGRDKELARSLCNDSGCMSPTADYLNSGGRRADFKLGVKYESSQMSSVAFDFSRPIYQNLTGPQMRTDWIASFKFGYMF